ncbi:hypothetical protein ACFL6F_02930, partial [Planctomycetota bacterium]
VSCNTVGYDYNNRETFTIISDVDLTSTFETVEQQYPMYTETDLEGAYFFSTQAEFDTFYTDLNPLGDPPPTIDFVTYRVVAYVDEYRIYKSNSVTITDIELKSGFEYKFSVYFYTPTKIESKNKAKPYHIIKVEIL